MLNRRHALGRQRASSSDRPVLWPRPWPGSRSPPGPIFATTPDGLDVTTWRAAQVIVLATDTACLDVAVRMPARPGIVLLGTEPTPAGLVDAARVLGVENTAVWPADERWLLARLAAATRAARTAAQTLVPGGGR